KVAYHKDGGSTHCIRFANEKDSEIENHEGVWFIGPLVGYNGFRTPELREKLMTHDFGSESVGIKDSRYKVNFDRTRDDSNDGSHNMVEGFDSGYDQ
ncbi:necrosis inducing protein-domain-containing protein, partial [Dactylonectria macrodidyma]